MKRVREKKMEKKEGGGRGVGGKRREEERGGGRWAGREGFTDKSIDYRRRKKKS